jgi:quinoprotein glucose dehydrogenase
VISEKPSLCFFLSAALVIGAAALAQSNRGKTDGPSTEWPTYGHDSGGMRFSPLTQITPANAARLKVAWVYHMRPA